MATISHIVANLKVLRHLSKRLRRFLRKWIPDPTDVKEVPRERRRKEALEAINDDQKGGGGGGGGEQAAAAGS